jgi:hypothetical protein
MVTKLVEEKVAAELKQRPASPPDLQARIAEAVKKEVKRATTPDLQATIQDAVEKEVKKAAPHAASSAGTTTQQAVSPKTHMRMTVENVTGEMKDRERRRNNVIIHGIVEPKSNVKRDVVEADTKALLEIIKDTLEVDVTKQDLAQVIRLGKKADGLKRPIKLTVASGNTKSEIFRNLIKLRNSNHNSVSFNHDMTPLEREQNKKLVEEAKSLAKKDETGQWLYRVRGPPWDRKILKTRKKGEKSETRQNQGDKTTPTAVAETQGPETVPTAAAQIQDN